MAQLYRTRFLAQQQGLREQPCQRFQVTLAELRERVVVRMLIRRQITEGHIFIRPGFDLREL